MWFPNRSDTNWPVQSLKQARSLKFWIYLEEGLYRPCSENNGADELRGYTDCVYTMFPAASAAPFARNVACRGVSVLYFSDFQDLLRFLTLYYDIRNKPW